MTDVDAPLPTPTDADEDLPDLPPEEELQRQTTTEDDELPEPTNSEDELPEETSDVDSDEEKALPPPSVDGTPVIAPTAAPALALPELPPEPEEEEEEEEEEDENWVKVQTKTFTRWCNSYLVDRQLEIKDLTMDLRDGTILINLLELLSGKKLGRYTVKPTAEIHKQENITIALAFIKAEQIKLVNIGSTDIYTGNVRLTLGLIWTLILRYQIKRAINEEKVKKKKNKDDEDFEVEVHETKSTRQLLLEWINRQLKPYRSRMGLHRITNFGSDWSSGEALSALTDSLAPNAHLDVDNLKGIPVVDTQNALAVCETVFKFPHLIDADDIVNRPDERSLMTYLAYFRLYKAQRNNRLFGTDPSQSYAAGPGVKAAIAGQKIEFTIYSKNRKGQPTGKGGDVYLVTVTGSKGEQIPCQLVDNKDGTYTGSYKTETPGPVSVDIRLQLPELTKVVAVPIKGSVYSATISSGGEKKKFEDAQREADAISKSEAAQRLKAQNTTDEDEDYLLGDDEDDDLTTDESEVEIDETESKEEGEGDGVEFTPEQARAAEEKMKKDAESLKKAQEETLKLQAIRESEWKEILVDAKKKDKQLRGDPIRLPDGNYVMPDGNKIIMPYGSLRWGIIKISARYDSKSGKIELFFHEARCLIPMQNHKYSNPYVKCQLLSAQGAVTKADEKSLAIAEALKNLTGHDASRKTKAHKKTLKPTFSEKMNFLCPGEQLGDRKIDISVWHKGLVYHVFLGRIELRGEELPKDCKDGDEISTHWYALQPRDLGGLTHSGSIEVSKDVIKYPDGSTKNADGTVTLPSVVEGEEGKTIPFDFKGVLPENGAKRLKDGCILLWDDTILLPSGAVTRPDGNLRMKDGSIQRPKWLLESFPVPQGAKQRPDFNFEVDGQPVYQPKSSNTALKLGVLKISARFYAEKQLVVITVLEGRGVAPMRGNKIGVADVMVTLRLLPIDKRLPRRERQARELKSAIIKKSQNPVFSQEFQFHVSGKKSKKARTVKELKQSTLQIKVWDHHVALADSPIGHIKVNLAVAVNDPYQWHAIVPQRKVRRKTILAKERQEKKESKKSQKPHPPETTRPSTSLTSLVPPTPERRLSASTSTATSTSLATPTPERRLSSASSASSTLSTSTTTSTSTAGGTFSI